MLYVKLKKLDSIYIFMAKGENFSIKGKEIKNMARTIPLAATITTILLAGTTGIITVWAADLIGTP